jgi:hypothetical protein
MLLSLSRMMDECASLSKIWRVLRCEYTAGQGRAPRPLSTST